MLHVAAASVSVTSPVTDFALEVGEGRAGRSERERGGCQHRVKLSARGGGGGKHAGTKAN